MEIKIKGEQFTKSIKFNGIKYDDCEQIIILISRKFKNDCEIYFLKNSDVNYSDAVLIEKSTTDPDSILLFFDKEKTINLKTGVYQIEIVRVVNGYKSPVLKTKLDIFEIQNTTI